MPQHKILESRLGISPKYNLIEAGLEQRPGQNPSKEIVTWAFILTYTVITSVICLIRPVTCLIRQVTSATRQMN